MTVKEFCDQFGMSRGQVERLVKKAHDGGGRFSVPGRGWFAVRRKGGKSNSPLDIRPDDAPPPSVPASSASPRSAPRSQREPDMFTPEQLRTMDQAELNRVKTIAEIRKIDGQTVEARGKIRAEVLAELTSGMAFVLLELRTVFDELELSADAVARLKTTVAAALKKLKEGKVDDRHQPDLL